MKKFMSVMLTVAMVLAMSATVFAGTLPTIKSPSSTGLSNLTGRVLGLVQFFGTAIAIGMLLYVGIKYMMASANEKADLKKSSINYVIGAILLFGASSIVGIIQGLGTSITEG